jgi:hypothetical protein
MNIKKHMEFGVFVIRDGVFFLKELNKKEYFQQIRRKNKNLCNNISIDFKDNGVAMINYDYPSFYTIPRLIEVHSFLEKYQDVLHVLKLRMFINKNLMMIFG